MYFFLANIESVIYWYFVSQFFKVVKDLHKLWFLILINKTTPNLIFVGHQIKTTHVNVYKLSILNYTQQLFSKNIFNFYHIVNNPAQR